MAVIVSEGYKVITGSKALASLEAFVRKANSSKRFILADDNTLKACLPLLITQCPSLEDASVIEVDHGEASKSLEHAAQIWQTLADEGADRQSLLVNLGGGVVTDLGGFCASLYMRGIRYCNVPTSLLAMADASVGAKTAIDFGGIKNLVGTFYPPSGVFIHHGFLNTLPPRERRNGMAEVMKMSLVADRKLWKAASSGDDSETVVRKAVALKNEIVLKDPYDRGERQALNFGHTVGHAIESAYFPAVLHGEAVAMGMIIETRLSALKGMLAASAADHICDVIAGIFSDRIFPVTEASVKKYLLSDKKRDGSKLYCTLLTAIGSCSTRVRISEAELSRAIRQYNKVAE